MLQLLSNALLSMLHRSDRSEAGQSTAEYAFILVLVSLVAIALLATIRDIMLNLLAAPLAGF